MVCFINSESGGLSTPQAPSPVRLADLETLPERERLRHLVIGTPAGVRSTIHTLHVLNYAEQRTWSKVLTVPQSGILITPDQGEVFSYLLRWRQVE